MTEEKWVWCGINIPFRNVTNISSTYQMNKYDFLPQIQICEDFKDVMDIESLVDFLHLNQNKDRYLFQSPTSCFFEIVRESEPKIFYADQQGCVLWGIDEQGRVVIDNGDIVAKTLPEFLTRIELENAIWYKTNTSNGEYTRAEKSYLNHYVTLSELEREI